MNVEYQPLLVMIKPTNLNDQVTKAKCPRLKIAANSITSTMLRLSIIQHIELIPSEVESQCL